MTRTLICAFLNLKICVYCFLLRFATFVQKYISPSVETTKVKKLFLKIFPFVHRKSREGFKVSCKSSSDFKKSACYVFCFGLQFLSWNILQSEEQMLVLKLSPKTPIACLEYQGNVLKYLTN